MEDLKEEKISEAQVEEISSDNFDEVILKERAQNHEALSKKKSDFYIEMILVFILGLLVGIAIKTEALKRITIGYDDYKMIISRQDYDINKFQSDMIKENEEAANKENSDNQSRIGDESQPDNNSGNNQP